MKLESILFFAGIFMAVSATGAFPPQVKELRAKEKAMMEDHSLIPPDCILIPAKGKIVLVNSQNKLTDEILASRTPFLEPVLCGPLHVEQAKLPFSVESAQSQMKEHGANVAFFIIDDPKQPMSLTCLEQAWGMVNFAKIKDGEPDEKVMKRRYAAELNRVIRSLLSVGGCGPSQMPTFVSRARVKGIPQCGKDLDQIKRYSISMNEGLAIHNNMASYGIQAAEICPYEDAVSGGWAPAPTNDIQKAIWEKVHAIPKNPMKIEFNSKNGR